jgi:hypothetical protein
MILPYVAWIAFWNAVFDPRVWTDAPLRSRRSSDVAAGPM